LLEKPPEGGWIIGYEALVFQPALAGFLNQQQVPLGI
jgi:hypothetical protein